jgi:hypothetical protein
MRAADPVYLSVKLRSRMSIVLRRPVAALFVCVLAPAAAAASPATPSPPARTITGSAPYSAPVLTLTATSAWTARLDWSLPPESDHIEIYRDGWLVDRFAAGNGTSYEDHQLWRSSSYSYDVRVYAGNGDVLADLTGSVKTPKQAVPFPRFYADTSFWNQRIPKRPRIDPNSDAIVATSLTPYRSVSVLNNNDHWGVPLAYAQPASKLYDVGCVNYGCNKQVLFRIPASARANFGSDGQLVIVDPTIDQELDMGRAVYDPNGDVWTTSSRYEAATDGWGAMCDQGQHCDGVMMSGLDEFGGVVRPEEIAQGHIDHALAVIVPHWMRDFIACPAVKSGGGYDDPLAIPMSARIQLDPSFDVKVQSWPKWEKVVARALQVYGGYITAGGGRSLEIRGETSLARGYDAWARVGTPEYYPGGPSLSNLPWDLFRVIEIHQC